MTRLHWNGGPTLDTSAVTWRGRALRYLLIYLLLLLALVTARYLTRDVRTDLRAAGARESLLSSQRDQLTLEVQSLSNVQRVRDWAFANGMHRFAEASKTSQALPVARLTPVPAARPLSSRVEVKIQWK